MYGYNFTIFSWAFDHWMIGLGEIAAGSFELIGHYKVIEQA